jgi:hypothetical protein
MFISSSGTKLLKLQSVKSPKTVITIRTSNLTSRIAVTHHTGKYFIHEKEMYTWGDPKKNRTGFWELFLIVVECFPAR